MSAPLEFLLEGDYKVSQLHSTRIYTTLHGGKSVCVIPTVPTPGYGNECTKLQLLLLVVPCSQGC